MTAINAVVLANEAHLFTDAGHYDPNSLILRSIGGKVHILARIPAVVAFTGPSRGGEAILRELERRDATDPFAAIQAFCGAVGEEIKREKIEGRYSALLLGAQRGVVIDEAGKLTPLFPGRVIKSLPSPIRFDPEDVVSSGLAMVIDQRARHGVVSGYCQHTVVRESGITSRILHRWPDVPVAAEAATIAAMIADLTVDTINFAPGAVTGVVSASGSASDIQAGNVSVNCPNPFGFPIKILTDIAYSYSGTAGSSSASIEIIINRDGAQLYDKTITFTGSGSKSSNLAPAFLDQTTAGHTYSMKITVHGDPNGSGGIASASGGNLVCLYTQK